MNRRQFLAAISTTPSLMAAGPDRPNIILCMADDLGWGDTGFNGNKIIKTPNLDAMAAAGIRFTRFYSGGSVCSPTRGTCLTGRHYFRYGVTHANEGMLPKQEFTLATLLKPLGYRTGHFGKWHLGTLTKDIKDGRRGGPGTNNYMPPWEHGFDVSFSTEQAVPTWDPMKNQPFATKYWEAPGKYASTNLEGDDSRIIMDRVVPFVQAAAKTSQPFLAVVWFHAPHQPVAAGPQYRALYSEYDEGQQHYFGCITALDEQVGRLRRELGQLGIAGNTMFWFASDNGPEGMTGEQGTNRGTTAGMRGRKRSLFSGGVNVPALLEWPGRAAKGKVIDSTCSTLDYVPTILQITGARIPGKPRPMDGESLIPVISGKVSARNKPLFFRYLDPKKQMHESPTITMVEGKYKFLTNLSESGEEDLLFDLVADRAETKNLVTNNSTVARSMKKRIKEWVASCKASHAGSDYDGPFTPLEPFDEVTGSWPKK